MATIAEIISDNFNKIVLDHTNDSNNGQTLYILQNLKLPQIYLNPLDMTTMRLDLYC